MKIERAIVRAVVAVSLLDAMAASGGFAQTTCNAVPPSPLTVKLPGHPFKIVNSKDGCWVFASMAGPGAGVAVLRRTEARLELVRTARIIPAAFGMVMTHDGKVLIATNGEGVVLLDVDRLTTGDGEAAIASVPIGTAVGTIYVNATRDDRFLFVSNESDASITVIDLALARSKDGASKSILGKIPVGNAPIALTFSLDERWLYTTSQIAKNEWDWPRVCDPENARSVAAKHALGAIVVVDVAKAKTDPSNAVASRVAAGCNPVRLAISPQGDRVYVTARKTEAVLVFDTSKMIADSEHAQVGKVPVGNAPVPVVVLDGGKKVIAGNSNRFGGGTQSSTLSVVDTTKAGSGGSVIGTISAGVFPRDLVLSSDGRTLFVANFGSSSLQAMDVAKLPVEPVR
jgi:DNA-binding beta-propeller fold protein YncE